jgi:hypothetical protein
VEVGTEQFVARQRGTSPKCEALKLPVLRLDFMDGALQLKPSLAIDGLAGRRFVQVDLTGGVLYVVNANDTVYRLSGADFKHRSRSSWL